MEKTRQTKSNRGIDLATHRPLCSSTSDTGSYRAGRGPAPNARARAERRRAGPACLAASSPGSGGEPVSSAVLYLAIVAVWAVVLVPMWLRRDTSRPKRTDEITEETPVEEEEEAPPPAPRRRRGRGRAAVIARRRRRTFGLTVLVLATTVVAATGLAPWWTVVPAVVLFAAHIALLRVAVRIDMARRRERAAAAAAARARAERAARVAERAAAQRNADVIELDTRPQDEVFDQYADDRRVVGE